MAFDWSDARLKAPAADEIEVVVIGPGFGESVVVHVGGGHWVVVDSCVDGAEDANTELPVAECYLRNIGVDLATQVDFIVATHWHDDHTRGLARLVEQCSSSSLVTAAALQRQEFATFVMQMSTGSAPTDGAKVREFGRVLRVLNSSGKRGHGRGWCKVLGNRVLRQWVHDTPAAVMTSRLVALSPSTEFDLFLERLANDMPRHGQSKKAASSSSPNLTAVVLHLEFDGASALLGADMEAHNDSGRGWNAVVSEARTIQLTRASLVKVPHHGSHTGHSDEMWAHQADPKLIGVLTPRNVSMTLRHLEALI